MKLPAQPQSDAFCQCQELDCEPSRSRGHDGGLVPASLWRSGSPGRSANGGQNPECSERRIMVFVSKRPLNYQSNRFRVKFRGGPTSGLLAAYPVG